MPRPKKDNSSGKKKKSNSESKKKIYKKRTKKPSGLSKKLSKQIAETNKIKKVLPKRKTSYKRKKSRHFLEGINIINLIVNVVLIGIVGFLIFKGITGHIGKKQGLPKKTAVVKRLPIRKRIVRKIQYSDKDVPQSSGISEEKFLRSKNPKIIFVIDDIGNTKKNQGMLESLRDNVTYAVLPQLPYSLHFAKLSRETQAELILHLPIEPKGGVDPGPGMLAVNMSKKAMLDMMHKDMRTVPGIVGMNNHTGSLGTEDKRLVDIVLAEVRRNKLFFLDSYTTANSVVVEECKRFGLPVLKRDIFLDNINEQEAISKQVDKLAKVANKKGYAIGIGHYRYDTFVVLNEKIPGLKRQGFDIITLEELIRLKKVR